MAKGAEVTTPAEAARVLTWAAKQLDDAAVEKIREVVGDNRYGADTTGLMRWLQEIVEWKLKSLVAIADKLCPPTDKPN
jgi:hypothetical protein